MRADNGRGVGAIASADIRRAVQRSELILEYQPLVSLRRGNVVGMEALVRWDHPTRGRIGPDAFIPVAEQGSEIEHLGRWVIRSACAQAAQWQTLTSLDREFSVSVNVSARQLTAGLVCAVTDALAATTCLPRSLVIELTETSAMADPEGTRCILRELDDLGVRTVVDDFGTGYSSLAYL